MGWLWSSSCVEYQIKPEEAFSATYPLSVVDGVMPKINSRYLFIWDTRAATADVTSSRAALVQRLHDALQSFLREPAEDVFALPELLGKIFMNPNDGTLTLKIDKTSTVSLMVSTRDDLSIESLEPEAGFPRRCMDPNIFATGIEPLAIPSETVGTRAFAAQLTFIRGGYVMCVNKHHSLLDATSTSRLIKWWFSKARSLDEKRELDPAFSLPSGKECVAMHDRTPLTETQEVAHTEHRNWKIVRDGPASVFGVIIPPLWVLSILKYLPTKLIGETRSHILYFSPASLQRIKAAATPVNDPKSRISTNDALVALVWTSIARARASLSTTTKAGTEEPQTSSCSVSVNIRPRLSPTLPASYFGNAVVSLSTRVPLQTLINRQDPPLSTTALALRSTLQTSTTDASIRSTLQFFSSAPKLSDLAMAINTTAGPDIYMNSWEGLFASRADLQLGYGDFQRMRLPGANAFSGFANVLPAYGLRDVEGGDGVYGGGLEVMLDLKKAEMEVLLKDEAFAGFVDRVI